MSLWKITIKPLFIVITTIVRLRCLLEILYSEQSFAIQFSLGPVHEFVQYASHLGQVISTVLG